MLILYVVSAISFAALLGAAIAISRHIRHIEAQGKSPNASAATRFDEPENTPRFPGAAAVLTPASHSAGSEQK